ncbi:MAG: TolC family protein, partial [Pseudomonadota bacterium]
NALADARTELSSAKIKLAYLMNIPPYADYKLDVSDSDFTKNDPEIDTPVDNLALLALVMRPESREEVLQQRIADRAATMEIMKTVPGLEILASGNYNSNDFLVNDKWAEASLTLTQNLIDIFTLPTRLNQQENNKKLAELRRKALLSAIITQTYVAHNSFDLSKKKYKLQRKLYDVGNRISRDARNRYQADAISEVEFLEIESDQILDQINLHNSFINMWHNHAMLIDTLGIDPLPNIDKDMSPDMLEALLNERYSSLNTDVIPGLLNDIKDMQKTIAAEGTAEDRSEDSPKDNPEPLKETAPVNRTERTAGRNAAKDQSNLVMYDPVFKANYEYLID